MSNSTFLTRVQLKNYKSIAACDIHLGRLMFLVGQNGAGKSNFLDALRLTADALNTTLDHALRDRGGINEVRRRSGGHPNNFGVAVEFVLPLGHRGSYSFRIGARPNGGFEVQEETCVIRHVETSWFRILKGVVTTSERIAPQAATDRLYLVSVSGLPAFAPLYEALSNMGFYNLNPASIREWQPPDAGLVLKRDGSNIASVLARLEQHDSAVKERIEEYLTRIVLGLRGVDTRVIGPKETLQFRQGIAGAQHPWRFLASNMSDGSLRALGILVALFQSSTFRETVAEDSERSRIRAPLVGIEEPEVALHPAAAGVVFDALQEASGHTQVIVTSHSPDLLDNDQIDSDIILAVESQAGVTRIGALDEVGRDALRQHLYTAGDLLRLNQLIPDPASIRDASYDQLKLFALAPREAGPNGERSSTNGESLVLERPAP